MVDVVETYRIVGENAVGAAFNQILRQSKQTTDRMGSMFKSAFGAFSLVAGGRTLLAWNKQAIEQADALGTLAEAFGTSTAELSRFDYAARQNNTTLEQLTPGLTAFQKNLVLAGEDSGRAQKALAALNLDADRLTRLPLPRQLEEIADAFSQVANPTDRVRISAQLFGDEVGRRMIPILAKGRDGLRALGEESDRLGNTLTKEVADQLRLTDAYMKQLEAQSMLLKRELAVGLGPAIIEIGKAFNATARGALNFGEALAGALHGPDEPVAILQDQLSELAERRNELLATVRRLEGSPLVLPGTLAKWKTELAGVEAEMSRVNAALQQFGRDAQAYEVFEPVVQSATKARKAAEILRELIDQIRASGMGIQGMDRFIGPTDAENSATLSAYFDGVMRENMPSTSLVIELDQAFEETNESAKTLMDTLKDEGARSAFDAISGAIESAGDGIDEFAQTTLNAFKRILADEATRQLFELLSGAGSGGGSSGGGWLGAIASGIGAWLGGGIGAGSAGSAGSGLGSGFRGLAANGMTLNPGEWAIAGEAGEEAVFGGKHGATIVPFDRGARGGGTVHVTIAPVTHVDARGASVELAQRLPAILAESNRRAVDEAEVRIVNRLQRRQYRGF